MTRVATGWLVYRLTGSAFLLGLVSFAGQIPILFLGPFAGVWVDRWDRHRVLVITQALSMLESFALAALALAKVITVHEVILLNLFQGAINSFDMPARQAFVIEMVENPEDLGNAIALNSSLVNVLDILQNFTLFATDNKHRRIKVICRYQQYFTTNQIVERVVAGYPKKGLIWHFQGSGKSLLMVFAAQKLRMHPKLGSPTVIIVVDRIDLDTQITATFNAADVPNMLGVGTRQELQTLLAQDVRKVLITTIHKFAEAGGKLNERSNIIVMVDEAHRTQEGDLGRKMRAALPNAFLFGLTGTPINRADKNTFWAFGADEDENGYMSRYSFQESIRDKATLPLHFEAPEVRLKIDKEAIDEAYKQITGDLSEQDRDDLAKRAAKMAVLVKNPERVRAVVNHIVTHFQSKVEPNGFKAQVVTFDRECCVLYKEVMDELIGPEASAIVMSASPATRQNGRNTSATRMPRRSCWTASAIRPIR